ncbi:MAG TPA: diguanylate cyclase [Polyangiaceae bacterium]|nr:diguanylate cyclase [Polyangiaceae bacterium]
MNRHEILLIEDSPDAREALALVLENYGYAVRSAGNGMEGLEQATLHPPDLVITDLAMPELSGLDLLQELRKLPSLVDVPVIVLSAYHAVGDRIAGFDQGADDFLAKPVNLDELLARVRRQLLRSERQREFARQSMVDDLTGVLNRRGLSNFFARESERVRADGATVAVMMVDLNDFKCVNDVWGHAAGDTALCAVARCLQDSLRAADRIGRMGGDEFAVVLPDTRINDCVSLAQRVRRISPIVFDLSPGTSLRVGLSLGISGAEVGDTFDMVLLRADAAMYEDKRNQKRASASLS